jgi:hypothetical protein
VDYLSAAAIALGVVAALISTIMACVGRALRHTLSAA